MKKVFHVLKFLLGLLLICLHSLATQFPVSQGAERIGIFIGFALMMALAIWLIRSAVKGLGKTKRQDTGAGDGQKEF